MKLLEEEGVSFRRVNYFLEPLRKEDLVALLRKGALVPRDLLRTREKSYREMGLADPNLDDDTILDALVAEPGLLQRPIVERSGRVVIGRPLENVRKLF
ncbi:MAG TPA: arsenate reductase (glutaredoxin) [Gemmatimonadetes bacterium]|nr:arsenate reductase (glutaredoxin) [Gemmatimonadota bacterium]HCK35053.1 arsenate reductase (glutaredoxin) [Gemmatimonadota bacterium]